MLIPESTLAALDSAKANGHKLFLCTGRNHRMTGPLLHSCFAGAVCSAGGYVLCDGKTLVDIPTWVQRMKACARRWNAMAWSARWKPGMPLLAVSK